MELFLKALDQGGPWTIAVLLLFLFWDRARREEKTDAEYTKALAAIEELLRQVFSCLQTHDRRVESVEKEMAKLAQSMEGLARRRGG